MASKANGRGRVIARTLALLGLILVPVTGCGPGVSSATGIVTYQGKTVVCGSVVFVGPDGMTKAAAIGPDGTYAIHGVGAGQVMVGVVSEDPARPLDPYKARGQAARSADSVDDSADAPAPGRVVASPPTDRSNWADPKVDRTKWFPLPKKYEVPIQSGVTVELKAGDNAGVDIQLR